ncbi:E3 ubiquitin-protein ligase FANCL-like [Pyrus ussuriensis x Pyrus communis]|uniref:E3 ubiquitin-protein ligase FANCL-like n=1 Tax=Pyrus ussuriensis x Pyrus communis TaxID=2448454 RepID=A0A5N5GQ17_9ROSA|nr:E3 ubiquitin-protein ligase FANCL-like [Pyrus ussuriensis x Pyrus communis]
MLTKCLLKFPNDNECAEQRRCRELARIEEVGWENLTRFSGDLTSLSFWIFMHVTEICLDKTHPKCPPPISTNVPDLFNLKWSSNSRLKDVVQQFKKHLETLQAFWSTLDDIDRSLWVVDPKQASPDVSSRQIIIGNDCCIVLSINSIDPRTLPECCFIGSGPFVNLLRNRWRRNSKRWIQDKPFLECLLETQLPTPPDVEKNDHQVECGICYAQSLPIELELTTCDNTSCNKAFHSICLVDWLRSITTRRQLFDVLFGSCPYCSEPVVVKINSVKK